MIGVLAAFTSSLNDLPRGIVDEFDEAVAVECLFLVWLVDFLRVDADCRVGLVGSGSGVAGPG
jgi:hypothetical protein